MALGGAQLAAFGIGSVAAGLFSAVPGVLLLFYMTEVKAVPATLAGITVFLPKLWDVVTDPLIGRWSDSAGRLGFMLMGSIMLPCAFAVMFSATATETVAVFVWILVSYLLATTAYTFFSIPYVALPGELGRNGRERRQLVSARSIGVLLGVLLGAGAAPIAVNVFGSDAAAYMRVGFLSAGLCLVTMLITCASVWTLKKRKQPTRGSPTALHEQTGRRSGSGSTALALCPLFCTQSLALVGLAICMAGLPYGVTRIGLGEDASGLALLCALLTAMLSVPLWVRYAGKRGEVGVMRLALLLLASSVILGSLSIGRQSFGLSVPAVIVLGAAIGGLQFGPVAYLARWTASHAGASGQAGRAAGWLIAAEKTGQAFGPLVVALALAGTKLSKESVIGEGLAGGMTPFLFSLTLAVLACCGLAAWLILRLQQFAPLETR
ncbi:MAG: MFS transporter [Pseudomonadota bacterium]